MVKHLLIIFSLSFFLLAGTQSSKAQACFPTYSSGCNVGDQIENFATTGGITNITNNNNGCTNTLPNNTHYFNMTVSQIQGLNFNFTVQSGTAWSQGFRMFIDWNQDGDFLDAGEDVWNSVTSSTNPYNGVVAIPLTATPGITRMRIVSDFANVPAGPCISTTWGETEEYNVNVLSSGPFDPAVTNIQVTPSGGCMDSNGIIVATITNYGSQILDLSINPLVLTLNVNGPLGLVVYTDTLNSGFLQPIAANSTFSINTGINFYDGGCYTINSDTFTVIGAGNGNLVNDSLATAVVVCNSRPNSGGDYSLCLGDTIPTGQGLSIINCPGGFVQDSVIIPFTPTFTGNIPPNPTNNTAAGASQFASATLPTLPPGANILSGELGVSNLQLAPLTFTTNPTLTRFTLFQGATIYHGGLQGSTLTGNPIPWDYLSFPPAADLNNMYVSGVPVNPTVNIGHWSTNRPNAPNVWINAAGTSTMYVKLVYEYVPIGVSWYEQPSGGVRISDSAVLNPLLTPNTIVNNSNAINTYTFYGACSADTNCRVAVNMIVTGLTRDSIVVSDVLCFGDTTGSIAAYVSGGTPGYTYTLSQSSVPISTNGTGVFTNLGAGSYEINVQDLTGCSTGDTTVIIGEPTPLVIDSIVSTSPSCTPGGDGTMTVYASGGTGIYSYNNGVLPTQPNNNVFINQSAINYTVTVTDANGCTVASTHTIVAPVGPMWASVTSTDALCNGDTSGTITVSATAGSSGIASYSSVGPLTQNTVGSFTGAAAGPYTVRVTDSNNCFVDSVVTINEPSALYFASAIVNNVSCNGDSNGSITVTAGGGTPIYQFSIPPATPTPSGTFNNLPAGPHTIRITDANGCTHDTIITITQPAALSISASSTTNVLCFGDTTGQIVMTNSGGTGPVTYTISPAATQSPLGTFTGLSATTYTITGTDANSCTATVSVTITQPATAVSITNITSTTPSCVPGCDANMTVTATGGTAGYTYSHGSAPAQGSNIFTSQCAGTYLVTVTDINGCTDTMSHTISTPGSPTWGAIVIDSVDCNGGNDGGFTVNVNIGTSPMDSIIITAGPTTIPTLLSTSSTTGTATNLVAGTYTVRAVDANGCAIVTNIIVAEPAALAISSVVVDSVNCFGASDGGFTVSVTGGTPVYNFCINTVPVQCNATGIFTALPQGPYTVTITDANNCTTTTNVTINQPSALSYTNVTTTNVSCNGAADGSITAMGTGGTNPLLFSLVPGAGVPGPANFTGLSGGVDTIRITDGNGCTLDSIVTIIEPAVLVIDTSSVTQVLCFNDSTGVITMTHTGGTGTVTYAIAPTYTNTQIVGNTISNLPAGTYTITGTDANSCTDVTTVIITQPATAVTVTGITGTTPSCSPGNDGTITITASGGTGTLQYGRLPIPPNTYQASNILTGLGSGGYSIRVIDANGCFADTSYTITNSSAPTIDSVTTVMTQCNGDSTGSMIVYGTSSAQATVTFQIIAPYTFPTPPQSSGSFTGLGAGFYTVQMNDVNNCPVQTTVQIVEPTPVVFASVNVDSVDCFGGNDGSIVVSGNGGTPGYTYSISPVATQAPVGTFVNLSAAPYTVTITDANNCTLDSVIVVSEPTSLTVDTVWSTNVLCNGDSTGTATVVSSGGTGTITYSINTTPVQTNTTGVFTNLTAINYTITSTDANSCSTTTTITVSQPAALSQTFTSQNVRCFGGSDGQIVLIGSGGVTPYMYGLLPNITTVGTMDTFNNLTAGANYRGILVDGNGCTDTTAFITITEPTQITFTSLTKQDIDCYGQSTGSISALATGGTPTLEYSIDGINFQASGNFNTLPAGTYTVTVRDANQCTITGTITIIENPQLFFSSITNIEETCYGDGTAEISFQGAGGVGPYTYRFNGGLPPGTGTFNTQTTYTGLSGGTYQIEITDNLGCTYDSNYTLQGPDRINFPVFDITSTTCLDTEDGKLTVVAAGGRGSVYTYSLEPGFNVNTNGIFRDLAPRQYTLRTTDTAGCFIDTIFNIPLPSNPMVVSITKEDLGCHGRGNEGKAEAVVTGGTPPYTYLWSSTPVQTTSRATGLYQGFHTVDVVDANGCLERDTLIIEPGPCCQEVFLPNAFSPNNDGRNDEFRILSSAGIELQQFEVRNRWGIKIWESYNTRSSWDGTYGGEAVNVGTYYYVLRYKCLTDGQEYTMKGDVIVVR